MNKKVVIIAVIVALIVVGWFGWQIIKPEILVRNITDFLTCAQAGYPIMESFPRQCRTPDGRNFVEQLPVGTDKSDLIVVDSPRPNETVKSPLVVRGTARGNWFFEASFPVVLQGLDGTVIAQTPAQAQGDWMTTEFVPFEAVLTFTSQAIPNIVCIRAPCNNATLVLKKDNPSGLPEHDDSISIPITLTLGTAVSTATCKPTGCSGQVCSDEAVITTCEYRSEYSCYKTAKCERQAGGQCGWTQTPTLSACLKNPPTLQ